MNFSRKSKPFRSGAILLALGIAPAGLAGGCGGSVGQNQGNDRIPEGMEKTKEMMKERMKAMRGPGAAPKGPVQR